MMSNSNQVIIKDFFVSYNKVDRKWSEWIAWQLEDAGYSTIIQDWDFLAGNNFVVQMDEATKKTKHTIAVLSPDYLDALYTYPEWTQAFAEDPKGEKGILLPVHIRECRDQLKGLFKQIVYIDLVGLDEPAARDELLTGVRHERAKPIVPPLFPGKSVVRSNQTTVTTSRPASTQSFPGTIQQAESEQGILPQVLPSIWNIPYRRNMFFTGRENVLKSLHERLSVSKKAVVVQTINGLGGVGKTQVAVEYAYRYQSKYQTVLWAKADSPETLVTDFVNIASLLKLPEKDAEDQRRVVEAVKRWLRETSDWLLILDNADNLTIVNDFIPSSDKGHLLITTRAQATGQTVSVEIEKMQTDEGALFLLRRVKIVEPDDPLEKAFVPDRIIAREISQVMDGLPLALEQAGAYIEQTQCGLSGYLERYQQKRTKLLEWIEGLSPEYPKPVATTWSLSFEQVKQANKAAADLLCLCVFLYADAIPEEIITGGALDLGLHLQSVAVDPIELDSAIGELLKFSLLRRNPSTKSLSIHRLVQAVFKDQMDQNTEREWAQRTVRAVYRTFPDSNAGAWQLSQRCLPHAQVCATLVQQWDMDFLEAAQLLQRTGFYLLTGDYLLQERAQFEQAEPLFQQALTIWWKQQESCIQIFGTSNAELAFILKNRAALYNALGNYTQAEQCYAQGLTIIENTLGSNHSDVADILDSLAGVYRVQRKYANAEPLYERALKIRKDTMGPENPSVANTLNNWALLYNDQGKYVQAEPLFKQSLAICEKILGENHPQVAVRLNHLAMLYHSQRRYGDAEPLFQRARTICEKILGPDHPYLATTLYNVALLCNSQEKYEVAESLFQHALEIREKSLGAQHPHVAIVLKEYAFLLWKTNRQKEAGELMSRANMIWAMHPHEKPASDEEGLSTMPAATKALEVFISFASQDTGLRAEIEKHLTSLVQEGLITSWHVDKLSAGKEKEIENNNHIKAADIILLLLSPNFIASDGCNSDVKQAMERHQAKEARVIPILLDYVDWKHTAFGKLTPLPPDEKFVSSWSNRNKAFFNITEGLRIVVEELNKTLRQPAINADY